MRSIQFLLTFKLSHPHQIKLTEFAQKLNLTSNTERLLSKARKNRYILLVVTREREKSAVPLQNVLDALSV